MPRQSRQLSGTGIYHVMMRGINHQNIFEDQEDYYQFLATLDTMAYSYEPDGTLSGRNYILYAYCLMSNHIHLLIREHEDTIGMAIIRIAADKRKDWRNEYQCISTIVGRIEKKYIKIVKVIVALLCVNYRG